MRLKSRLGGALRLAAVSTDEQDADTIGDSPLTFVVRVTLDNDHVGQGDHQGAIKLGLGGTAEIITGSDSLLEVFFKRIRQTIRLS